MPSNYTYANTGNSYPSEQGHGHHWSEIVDHPKFHNVVTYTMAETSYAMKPVDCAGVVLETTSASAVTITIDPTLFEVGDCGEICQIGAGTVTIVASNGVLRSFGSLSHSGGQYAVIGWRIRAGSIVFLTGNLI